MFQIQGKNQYIPQTLAATHFQTSQYADLDNLAIIVKNTINICRLIYSQYDLHQIEILKNKLKQQFKNLNEQSNLQLFPSNIQIQSQQLYQIQKKLLDLQSILRQLEQEKLHASSNQNQNKYQQSKLKYLSDFKNIIFSKNILKAIDQYSLYGKLEPSCNQEKQQEFNNQNSQLTEKGYQLPLTHYKKQLINTKINYQKQVFSHVNEQNKQYYLVQAARCYQTIAPFKIKTISLSIQDGPTINYANFYDHDLEQSKKTLSYCVPNTKNVAYYFISDLIRSHTFSKQFYHQRQLNNKWNFSQFTKTLLIPNGKIYAFNCKSTKQKIDSNFYQIGQQKASNRGQLPAKTRDSSFLYLNGYIYMIGGRAQGEKCSRKNYRYSIKAKKWQTIGQSNVALRKATICTFGNRFIFKIGGLNEFDYINKIIEMYDSTNDKWSLVRAAPRNILEQVQILQDSQAIQIKDDQVYVFGGKNANRFSSDTGFVLSISQIRQRKKGAAKVSGQLWNVSIGKRNILTFFGDFSQSTVLIQHNCIYGLRTKISQTIAP